MVVNAYNRSSLEDLLLVLRRNMLKNLRKEGLQSDLTLSQIEVLHFVGLTGRETMKSIAEHLKITPPSATEIIAEMEKRGLVRREKDKNDRRVVFVAITNNAKRLFASLSRRKSFLFKKMISRLSKNDIKALERIIKILIG